MDENKKYNSLRETLELKGTKSSRKKKYKTIIEELGAREMTLADIGLGDKDNGLLDMLSNTSMTLNDWVILQQYSKAILQADTRSAEFLRDTSGQKPSMQLDVNNTNGLKEMSYEELLELKESLANKDD